VPEARSGPPDDQLHAAIKEAVEAFSEARMAFQKLERDHLPDDFGALGQRLQTLGDALSAIRGHAAEYRQYLTHRDPGEPTERSGS
jgi:hypothetical protein